MKISMTDSKGMIGIYGDSISQLSSEFHTVGGVLYCCVESVVFVHSNTLLKTGPEAKASIEFNVSLDSLESLEESGGERKDDLVVEKDKEKVVNNVLAPSFIFTPEGEFLQLQTTGTHGIFQCLLNKTPDFFSNGFDFNPKDDTNVIVIDIDDGIQKRFARAKPVNTKNKKSKNNSSLSAGKLSEEGLFEFEKNAIIRSHIYRLLAGNTIPLKPTMTAVERGIKETELLSFSSLSTTDLYRSNQLQEANDMLLSVVKPLPNFTGSLTAANSGSGEDGSVLRRRFFRNLSGLLFAQLVRQDLAMEPTVVQRYYPLTETLLYSLYWPPLNRRMDRRSWSQTISSGTQKQGTDDDGSRDGLHTTIDTVTLTPAGKSLAFIKRFDSSGEVWLSVFACGSLLGLRQAPVTAPSVPTGRPRTTSDSAATKLHSSETVPEAKADDMTSLTAADAQSIQSMDLPPATPLGCFFCHTEDDVRILAFPGPSPTPSRKPDQLGTVCLVTVYPHGLSVTACSNGTVRIVSPTGPAAVPLRRKPPQLEPLEYETSRIIGAEGITMRNLLTTASDGSGCPYSQDILTADGTRTLVRAQRSDLDGMVNSYNGKDVGFNLKLLSDFHKDLLSGAPVGWRYIRLGADGSVLFFTCPVGTIPEPLGTKHPSIVNIRNMQVDAETKCEVATFKDGRMILTYVNGRSEIFYNDGTKMTTHSSGNLILVEKAGLPKVEIDVEIDSMCRSHADGVEVPINKGGERVRSRIAMLDGSAILIKYDTKVTAKSNGSVKLVGRDCTVMLVQDSGVVTYTPRTAWNAEAAKHFADECSDGLEPPKSPIHTATANSTKSFNTTNRRTAQSDLGTVNTSFGAAKQAKPMGGRRGNISKSALKGFKTSPTDREKAVSFESPSKISEDVFVSAEARETQYSIDFNKLTCRIQDYEYNCFDIDLLHNPMEPKVNLSGEVDGLKPPAVTDSPMDPRLFFVNRAGDATEVVSIKEINGMENYVSNCSDCTKIKSEIEVQRSDLGHAMMHKYLIQKRLLGKRGDEFSFADVFGQRSWQSDKYPAAALHSMRTHAALKYRRADAVFQPQRYFESWTLVEHQPLSQEGYARLKQDIARCEEFRSLRLTSIDRFAVDDHRTQMELEEEEAIVKKLKQAYKIAKVNAAKKKELRDREKAALPSALEVENTSLTSIIPEGDDEDDSDDSAFGDEEEAEELDPETQEVHNTFFDFATTLSHGDNVSTDSTPLLAMHDLQIALIQLLNRYVSQSVIDDALKDCGGFDASIDELTLPEFKGIYKSAKKFLFGISEEMDGLDEDRSPTPPHNPAFDEEEERVWSANAKGTDNLQKSSHSNYSKRSKSGKRSANSRSAHSRKSTGKLRVTIETGGVDSIKMRSSHSPTQFSAIDEYWNSPEGKKSIGLIPKMALPLDLRPLRADYKAETDNVFVDDDDSYAAGSAVNAVRKSYNNAEQ